MKLYDSVGPNPRVVRMFMAEKGIEMPKQTVDLRKGENREAEHLKRNPHGQMPTLELDNGNYLSEITAICEYLEEKHPNPPLIGTTPEERAECRMWTRRVDLNICEHMGNGYRFGEALKFFEKRIPCAPEASPGLKMIAANRLQWLNGQMADGRDYLCGKRFTLADILLYGWLDFAGQVGQPLDPANTNIVAWMARVGRAAVGEGVSAKRDVRFHPPLEGAGRLAWSVAKCETGRGDSLSTRALSDVERPSPHLGSHCMRTDPPPPGEDKSDHHRCIRQFICPTAALREMLRQFARHGRYPLDHAALEVPCPEIRFHLLADFFPALAADPGVYSTIGHNLEIVVGQQQVDQDAVVVDGVPDPQLRKNIQRPLPRRLVAKQRPAVERAFDHETHLPGMRGLTRLDRLLDLRQRHWRKDTAQPPAVFDQMPADAPDAHATSSPMRRRRQNCRRRH